MGDWNRELHHHEHHDDIEMWRSRLRIAEEALSRALYYLETSDAVTDDLLDELRGTLSRIHTAEER